MTIQPLSGDKRRQADAPIRGMNFQAWWSIEGWLRLKSADEVVFVEGAEDYDVTTDASGTAVQVKLNVDPISLGTEKAREAIQNFWNLVGKEPHRTIEFHYLTSSRVALERDAAFNGMTGIDAWRAAQTSDEAARLVAQYLAPKLPAGSLRAFLETATPLELQEKLFRRFVWLTDQGEIEVVKQSVDSRIAAILIEQKRPLTLVTVVRKYLESRYWEVVTQRDSADRRLDFSDLHAQIAAATSVTFVVPFEGVTEFLATVGGSDRLLDLLLQPLPAPPSPLLPRPALLAQIENVINARAAALLVGTVFKGKSTLAQTAARTLHPAAWWVDVKGLKGDQLQLLSSALAERIGAGAPPGLLILDDVDLSPTEYQRYRRALELLIHRAYSKGCGVILTARGSADAILWPTIQGVQNLEVSEVGNDEIRALCESLGCPNEVSAAWAALIEVTTQGHPALIQVRLAELSSQGWPTFRLEDFTTPSPAIRSVKQITRELLAGMVSAPIAEFIYTLSEATIPLAPETVRELAIASSVSTNPGDEIDRLTGKWIERVTGGRLRVTALLKGVASDVWSAQQLKAARIRIRDAIVERPAISPAEAAELIFHGFLAQAESRLAHDAMRMQVLDNAEAQNLVNRHLVWLPYVALEPNARLAPSAFTSTAVRSLQFRVAVTLESESIPRIAERWRDDVEHIDHPDARLVSRSLMLMQVSTAETPLLPLELRLRTMSEFRDFLAQRDLPPDLAQVLSNAREHLVANSFELIGVAAAVTPIQMLLVIATRYVRGLAALRQFGNWLENESPEVHGEVDSIIEWPVVQQVGAFVHTAWSAVHESTTSWDDWLQEFDRQISIATRAGMNAYGRELIKAKSILLTEYREDSEGGLEVLREGAATFGASAVLLEQDANVRFQRKDDREVIELWRTLSSDPTLKSTLDPFAYRRIAISAARLGDLGLAAEVFHHGSEEATRIKLQVSAFALLVDQSFALCLAGQLRDAALVLVGALLVLPTTARAEGDVRWEAVQRVASEVARTIERAAARKPLDPKIEVGSASSPATTMKEAGAGQDLRTDLVTASAVLVAASLGGNDPMLGEALLRLRTSDHAVVRWTAARAQIALDLQSRALGSFCSSLEGMHRATLDLQAQAQAPGDLGGSEQWLGLLIAAVACSNDLPSDVARWRAYLDGLPSPLAGLNVLVARIEEVLQADDQACWQLARDVDGDPLSRCVAARRLLDDVGALTAAQVSSLEVLIASGTMWGISQTQQDLFNRAVAKAFMDPLQYLIEHAAFSLHEPRNLKRFLEEAAGSPPSIGDVLKAASRCAGRQFAGLPSVY